MSVSNRFRRFLTINLLMALAFACERREVEAGLAIVVTDTIIIPAGDPLAQYDFKLSLAAGNLILPGDNITLQNIPNFNGDASYRFMSGGIDYSNFFSIVPSEGSSAGLTNIELVLTAAPGTLINIDPVNNLAIGDLYVTTNVEYPPAPGSPLFNPINYTSQTHLYPSGTLNMYSSVTTPSLVPEPASGALLGVGIVAGLLVARGRRRPTPPG